tara:strand:- start:7 stop:1095 length:1089 start_codon:yes stop_codon:yes gene_type:complete
MPEENSTSLKEAHDLIKEKGFPYYPNDRVWRENIFNQLINFRRDTLIDRKTKIIGQSAHGLNLAWSFMEHAWGIKCGKMKTPIEIWEDEEHLSKGINKILTGTFFKQKPAHNITDSDMRSMLRRYTGTQMVSNFRPTAAAALYDIFVEKDSPLEGTEAGTVWDPSMGYGGRLLGAIAAGVNYIGTDPCIPTYDGLKQICNQYGHSHKRYTLLRQGSETFLPEKNSIDFVFTSPPYFGWEAYGDEPEQSSIKFDTSEEWKEKFLKKTIANAYDGLKPGKFLALNVANTKQYKTFEEDTVDLAVEVGFKHTDTWWLSLSTQQGGSAVSTLDGVEETKQKQRYMGRYERPDISGRKYEPTFIFQK